MYKPEIIVILNIIHILTKKKLIFKMEKHLRNLSKDIFHVISPVNLNFSKFSKFLNLFMKNRKLHYNSFLHEYSPLIQSDSESCTISGD